MRTTQLLSRGMWLALLLAVAGVLVSVAPVLGAKPTRDVIDIGTPDDEAGVAAFLSGLCGFPISASIDAQVTVLQFESGDGEFAREIDVYQIKQTFTNVETGESVFLHDVGPDIFWLNRDGELMQAFVGRSLTGSGVIGRVVVNLDTGEELLRAGRDVGLFEVQVCEPLAS